MKKNFLFVILFLLFIFINIYYFNFFFNLDNNEKYKNWDDLKKHQVPKWFNDSKFGIFIHWGIYRLFIN
jgi:hypothetical protein